MPITINQRRAIRIAGFTLSGLLVLGLIGGLIAYSKRESLLRSALDRGIRKAKRDYSLTVRIGSARFTGLRSVAFTDISVVPDNRDSLARIDRVEVGVRLWPLLVGNVSLSDLTLQNGLIQVVKHDSLTNIDFLLHRKKDSTATTGQRTNLADVTERLIDNLLSKIPDNLNIKNLGFRLIDSTRRVSLLTETARIDNEAVTSTLRLNNGAAIWHVSGTADPSSREYNLALYADGRDGKPRPLELPYLQERFHLKLQADTVRAELRDVDRSGGEFRLEGAGSVTNLRINHPAISPTDVLVNWAAMDANLFVGENYVGVDSSSTIYLGQVSARPFVKYTLSPAKVYNVQLHTDPLDAQALFNSFPRGLFESLEGIRVSGKLKYDLLLNLDTALPDSVKFDSKLTADNFKILKLGKTNFTLINQPFVYTPYEKGKPVRDIIVGPQNPDYTPINTIAPDLRNALLTSEDYNFFTHKGFNEKAFRVSIATNYKAGSFKRGASTVSMQLVKNAFLNRNKTLSRKVEEILIVWLIENQHLVSKERMYEVYLNIIEWGRNVYGIGEAARYYFGKSPAELDLGESIFLAFVVPKPKAALNYFQPDGSLQARNVRGYFRLIGKIMAKRGLTLPDSGAYGFYGVRLREGLRRQIAPTDSSRADSLLTEPDEEGGGIDDFFNRLFQGKTDAADDKADEKNNKEVQPAPTTRDAPLRDLVEPQPTAPDTLKTPKQLRQERRERRRREKEEQKRLEEIPKN